MIWTVITIKTLINGYSYQLLDEIECDGQLCIAKFEVERYGNKVDNIDEIIRYVEQLIKDIMINSFKEKYKSYDKNGSLQQTNGNIYELKWTINMKKDRFRYLKKYCEGQEIQILSGDLCGKNGLYGIAKNNCIFKENIEYMVVGEHRIELNGKKFEFVDSNVQMTYEEIQER